MKRFPTQSILAGAARWGAWLIVLLLLWYTGAAQASGALWRWVSFVYITAYAVVWTLLLPRIMPRVRSGSVVVLYDLLLTSLPVWFTGGWASPFLPFALSTIVIPASRGWRAGMLLAAMFLAVDQVILWITSDVWELARNGQSLGLLGRTLLPFGIAAATTAGVGTWRGLHRRRALRRPRPLPSPQLEYPNVRTMLEHAGIERGATYGPRVNNDPPARAWSKERAAQPTLERHAPTSVQSALRHCAPDVEAAGITLSMTIEGDERRIGQQIHDLLCKAVEIALDNVVAHAHARTVDLVLQIDHDHALLIVADDGIGLFDGTAEPPGFHQLKRLRFRAEELGGSLLVDERDHGGVLLQLSVPLSADRTN